MKKLPWLKLILLVALVSACTPTANRSPKAELPAGMAYADGKEIYFVHTEASSPDVADALTNMMDSPVLLVPSLANMPSESLGTVYVFTNGIAGKGPFGFQPDVFADPPGSPNYTPLRSLHLVTWNANATARLLTSATEVQAALESGELSVEIPGIVVNMPFVVWDGGKR